MIIMADDDDSKLIASEEDEYKIFTLRYYFDKDTGKYVYSLYTRPKKCNDPSLAGKLFLVSRMTYEGIYDQVDNDDERMQVFTVDYEASRDNTNRLIDMMLRHTQIMSSDFFCRTPNNEPIIYKYINNGENTCFTPSNCLEGNARTDLFYKVSKVFSSVSATSGGYIKQLKLVEEV